MRSLRLRSVIAAVSCLVTACGGGSTLAVTPATPAPTSTTASTTATPSAAPTINPAAIPLGGQYSTASAQAGYVLACQARFNGGGASTGPWINTAGGTWNSQTKLSVQGSVAWPSATNSFTVSGSNFVISSNDLPVGSNSGTFPIASTDPAYQYDKNPNRIAAQNVSWTIPLNPTVAATPSCLPGGPIGVAVNGIVLFNGQDALSRDAGAYEVLDACGGHPESNNQYHYHSLLTSCLTDTPDASGHSSLLGYAFDGFGIYGNLTSGGVSVTNASLDVCHGHTHSVTFHGSTQTVYHYHTTREYPYSLGCYRGQPIAGY